MIRLIFTWMMFLSYQSFGQVWEEKLNKDGIVVFTRETLSALEELTEASWQLPFSSRVNSITNFQHTRVDEDDLIVEDLVQNAAILSDEELAEIQKIALTEPDLVNDLVYPIK